MDLKLKPHEWADGEAYTVHIDGGGEKVSDAVGYLWRRTPEAWGFMPGDTFDPSYEGAPTIHCSDPAGAIMQVKDRLKVVEVPADRLSNAQMYGVTSQHLITLAVLAKSTNSRPGFISALASAVARSVVVELRPDGEAAFMRAFTDEVVTNIKSQRTMDSASEALATAFAALFKDDEASDEAPHLQHH